MAKHAMCGIMGIVLCLSTARADGEECWQRWGRYLGWGWGDGYHAAPVSPPHAVVTERPAGEPVPAGPPTGLDTWEEVAPAGPPASRRSSAQPMRHPPGYAPFATPPTLHPPQSARSVGAGAGRWGVYLADQLGWSNPLARRMSTMPPPALSVSRSWFRRAAHLSW